ncbi:hypothetical protein GLAREA_06429 [Glarea lozoyensis ATCC 20868]|uniref:MARVEL domain-containing protein n=1 Tax=Glarea lozoyensis (strain ATCC 20868 / MF5171) TaxID=1116229 RepID=S3DMU1_GLAL2|nr:uncharacterized protein GLAREA_06429 [Glarea lozoyensis ATCC 20868]EPE33416.1 hypothetical protein GLAREA_06429 [Glarea lozoyensis ATCC 20868]
MAPKIGTPHLSMASEDTIDRDKNPSTPFLNPDESYALQQADEKLKKKIRYLRFIARLAATALAIATVIQESRTLAKYLSTKNIQRGDPPRGPWAKQTSLWPSIMLTSVSAITVLTGLLIMSAYARSIRHANAISLVQTWFVSLVEGAHVITWIVVAILYRVGKSGDDLWGWACSPVAERIQPGFEGLVNFGSVCSRGSSQWRLTLASACLQLLTGIIFYLMWQRRKVKKTMKKNGMFSEA